METININGKEYTKDEFLKASNYARLYKLQSSLIFKEIKEDFPRHETTPPTVRPMSELPKDNEKHYLFAYVDVANFKEVRYTALCNVNNIGLLASWGRNFKSKGHLSLCGNFLLVGWLYELPNPNDIKL